MKERITKVAKRIEYIESAQCPILERDKKGNPHPKNLKERHFIPHHDMFKCTQKNPMVSIMDYA